MTRSFPHYLKSKINRQSITNTEGNIISKILSDEFFGVTVPDMKFKIDEVSKSYNNGWVRVDNSLKHIDTIWIRVNDVLKKI